MKTTYWFASMALLVTLALAGCGGGPTGKGSDSESKQYDIKGTIVSLAPDRKAVTLDGEEIPGLMKAMKMEYRVEDAKVLEGVKPGDPVHGKLKVKSGDYIITHLGKR